jgi:hypothetical protein
MVINLQLLNGLPTTVKVFSKDGTLQTQAQFTQLKSSIDLGALKAGTYILALSNSILRHTSMLRVF